MAKKNNVTVHTESLARGAEIKAKGIQEGRDNIRERWF